MAGTGESSFNRSETILVCDDDRIVLDATAFLLESKGYEVLRASSGRAALEVAASFPGKIDLLLTDVNMPEMNGWELARQLCALRPECRVLFVCGDADDVRRAGASAADHVETVQKPAIGDTLFRRIREVLETPTASG